MNRFIGWSAVRRWLARSEGSAFTLTVLMLPVLLALLGLVIDGAFLTRQVLQLETAVDAAARAATDAYDHAVWQSRGVVVIDEAQAAGIAQTYLTRNMDGARLVSAKLEPNTTNRIRVIAEATITFPFMRIMGVKQRDVRVWSVAMKQ